MTKEKNVGISILRIFFCFMVICFHYDGNTSASNTYYMLRELAVPVFMMMAFLLGEKVICSGDNRLLGKRIIRLIIPYIGWGIISYLFYIIIRRIFGYGEVIYSDIIWQLILGNSPNINPPLWFQWELIVITLLFSFLFRICSKNKKVFCGVLIGIIIVSYVLQYTLVYERLFLDSYEEVRSSIGRLIEVLPFAAGGLLCSLFKMQDKLEKKRVISLVLLWLGVVFSLFNPYIIPAPKITFAYAGVGNMIVAFFIIFALSIIPNNIYFKPVKDVINFMAKYSMGIYFVHWVVGDMINILWMKIFGINNTFTECFVIYGVSFALCFLISLIPNKYIKALTV